MGGGVFHPKGWWPKSSCAPSKVCLPWVSKRGPGGVQQGCATKVCAHFSASKSLRVGFRQSGFFADFYFRAAGFFRGFCCRIFSPHFCGEKCPEKSSRKIPGKILQNLYNKNPRHISAEGPGQKSQKTFENEFGTVPPLAEVARALRARSAEKVSKMSLAPGHPKSLKKDSGTVWEGSGESPEAVWRVFWECFRDFLKTRHFGPEGPRDLCYKGRAGSQKMNFFFRWLKNSASTLCWLLSEMHLIRLNLETRHESNFVCPTKVLS